jgi:hypothetical protein
MIPSLSGLEPHSFVNCARDQARRTRRFDTGVGACLVPSDQRSRKLARARRMNFKWLGALRAYKAAGRNPTFNELSGMTGAAAVTGALIPALVTFADPADPATACNVAPDGLEVGFGNGFRLRGMTAEVVWLSPADGPAATAIKAAGLPTAEPFDASAALTRKLHRRLRPNLLIPWRPAGMIRVEQLRGEIGIEDDEKAGGRCNRKRLPHRKSICDTNGRRAKSSRGGRGFGRAAADVRRLPRYHRHRRVAGYR